MALSDLQVFNEYAYSTFTELLDYNVDLFNQATRGGILLQSASHQGDYSDTAVWAKISGLVRRRDAYGSGAVSEKVLTQKLETTVKVAAGIPPVRIDPSMMLWIQRSPEEAGAVVGRQMAIDALADMLNAGLGAYANAISNVAGLYNAATGGNCSLSVLNTTRAKLGDRADSVVCWVMHSKPLFDIFGAAITNSNTLFTFGNVRVVHDGFGNPFVVSDSANLLITGTPNNYWICGLVTGGITIDRNNDFQDNTETINGAENIKRTYQAEWSFNLGLKGFQWDKTNGGHSPNATNLNTATNWDQWATSVKDCAGVIARTQ